MKNKNSFISFLIEDTMREEIGSHLQLYTEHEYTFSFLFDLNIPQKMSEETWKCLHTNLDVKGNSDIYNINFYKNFSMRSDSGYATIYVLIGQKYSWYCHNLKNTLSAPGMITASEPSLPRLNNHPKRVATLDLLKEDDAAFSSVDWGRFYFLE